MDNKYGRLFTAEDMLAFAAIVVGSDISGEDALDELLDDFEGRFPKEEPLFLLRGQDKRALACVRNYRTMVAYSGAEPDQGLLAGLRAVIVQFEDFAREHPEKLKDAD